MRAELISLCPHLQIVGQDTFGIWVKQGKVVKGGEDLIGNVLALITEIIAAGLYGNIGISKYPTGGKQSFFIYDHFPKRGGMHEMWMSTSLLSVFMSSRYHAVHLQLPTSPLSQVVCAMTKTFIF